MVRIVPADSKDIFSLQTLMSDVFANDLRSAPVFALRRIRVLTQCLARAFFEPLPLPPQATLVFTFWVKVWPFWAT